jgi:hypothetical protein
MAIYAIVRGKEPQEEMAYMYEIFAKYNQDTKVVGHIEKYQREVSFINFISGSFLFHFIWKTA